MPKPFFDPAAVHAPARLLGWFVLAFSAGAVNAIAFAACARFVTHVTGIVTRIGLDAGHVVLLLEYFLVLGAFVLGAASAVALCDGRRWRGLSPRPWLPLAAVSAVLGTVGVAGELGAFGTFGGGVEEPGDFALLTVLAFAMGMQNAGVATATGMLVRTTHMTGPATDLGIAISTLLHAAPAEVLAAARASVVLRAGKIASFAAGAGAGLVLAHALGYVAFAAPALAVTVVAMSMLGATPSRSPALRAG